MQVRAFERYIPLISIRIVILTHSQINKNACSNQEIHVQFEHGFKLEHIISRMLLFAKSLRTTMTFC